MATVKIPSALRAAYKRRKFVRIKIRAGAFFEIDNRYQKPTPIGDGAYGVVCSAEDRVSGRKVAIKKVTDVFEDLVDAKRILREVKLLRHLGCHPNVTTIYDVTTSPAGTGDFADLYIITDLYECDLERIITSSQELSRAHQQYFLYQILRGLKFIHSANVLHRDLKPSNILVNSNCDLAICDFGLSRGAHDDASMTDYVVTRWYRAPEILCDNKKYDKAVDVWSCGLIFAELLLRKPLLQGKDYVHQLRLIVKLLGKPTEDDLESLTMDSAKQAIRRLTYKGTDFMKLFRETGAKGDAIDLIKQCLTFDYRKRITVEMALEHEYMKDLHNPDDEHSCKTPFDDSFEKGYKDEMPKRLLQSHMLMEACLFSEALEGEAAALAK